MLPCADSAVEGASMAKQLTMATRAEVLDRLAARYAAAARREKSRILGEFVEISGYHRKHAVRLLRAAARPALPIGAGGPRQGRRIYDEAVKLALIQLWEAADRICGKRLAPLIPDLVKALEHHGHLQLDASVRAKVLKMSAASIDRLLSGTRDHAKRRARTASLNHIRRQVPVRTHGDWREPPPGYFEMDFVAHCGGQMSGAFVWTLAMTDVASGWTECIALPVRDSETTIAALETLRRQLPMPLLGLDVDNDSAFMNADFIAWCDRRGVELTRSRPYKKNDQAFIEQKNGAVVRKLAGYKRLEGVRASRELGRLYAAARVFVNVFQPSFKLISKVRIGSAVKKRYSPPLSPARRLLAHAGVDAVTKDRLRRWGDAADPVAALSAMRHAQDRVATLATAGRDVRLAPPPEDLKRFMQALATTWKHGDPRATHQALPAMPRTWRTRVDPLRADVEKIRGWLDTAPDLDAVSMLRRLQTERPGVYADGVARTLQRRLKHWRREVAHRLVFGADDDERFREHADEATSIDGA
jgi:transposase InsO family protein